MLTSDTRAFSWTVQLLTPAGRLPGGRGWTTAERTPQDSRCEGQCGAAAELASRRRKPLLGQKSRPLQRSDVRVDKTAAAEGPRQQVGGQVLPAPRGGEPLDVVGGGQGDVQQQWVPGAGEAELPGHRCGAGSVCEPHGQPVLSLGSTRTWGSRSLILGESPTQLTPSSGQVPGSVWCTTQGLAELENQRLPGKGAGSFVC